eukprot:GHVU01102509.1.p4 GENE.GHVU01102509.1~~GHVU01102509.1.p4  ORF type:complete len:148 (+),score=9.54 GHVU01102509.1:384-827(+)
MKKAEGANSPIVYLVAALSSAMPLQGANQAFAPEKPTSTHNATRAEVSPRTYLAANDTAEVASCPPAQTILAMGGISQKLGTPPAICHELFAPLPGAAAFETRAAACHTPLLPLRSGIGHQDCPRPPGMDICVPVKVGRVNSLRNQH